MANGLSVFRLAGGHTAELALHRLVQGSPRGTRGQSEDGFSSELRLVQEFLAAAGLQFLLNRGVLSAVNLSPAGSLPAITRRHLFSQCGMGVGGLALASLLAEGKSMAAPKAGPGAPLGGHLPGRAKNVIFLFMAGGPSQLELFENKPKLLELNGKPVPPSLVEGKRFAFMDSSHRVNLLASRRPFQRHGQSGAWVSDLLPHTAGIVDEISIVTSCKTELFNHAPAKLFMNTGSGQFGRPSLGSWVAYGLGSESADLPAFVVLQSGPRGPRGGAVNWGSGFLPTTYQGVPLRSLGEPILTSPPQPASTRAASAR
jgi:hypothetical protein